MSDINDKIMGVKVVKHSDTDWSVFYTQYFRRYCVDCDITNGTVTGVRNVWVVTEDGYNDCIITDTESFFENNKELLTKLFGGTYEH